MVGAAIWGGWSYQLTQDCPEFGRYSSNQAWRGFMTRKPVRFECVLVLHSLGAAPDDW